MAIRSFATTLLLPAFFACTIVTADPEAGRDAVGATAAVTAGHPLAAEAGLAVLRNGGNAMDAAITMAAVLAVARPHMNGVGGDMFLIYYDHATRRPYALNASGRSGTAATLAELRARGLDDMPGTGPTSVSVPGAVGGWAEALERFGTLSWRDALEPAVQLARSGLPVSERLSSDIEGQISKVRRDTEASRIFWPNETAPAAGDRLQMPELAATLERIQQNGPQEVYTGETGRRVVEHLTERGGLLCADDLAANEPV